MRESQYADDYIDSGYTIGTYLHHVLHGNAKGWADVYERSLRRAMDRRVAAGTVVKGWSVHGGIAYFTSESVRQARQVQRIVNRLEAANETE